MVWHWKPAICFSVNVRNCMCIVATLHLLNVSCKITQQILIPIFTDFISPPGGIISFNTSGFSKKGQKPFIWIKIHLMKHSIKEIKEKNQTRVTVTQRGGGGGTHQRGSAPGTNPLPFVCTILDRKGTPFVYPLVTNGTPFTYLILNAASLFNCCKYTIFTIWINS